MPGGTGDVVRGCHGTPNAAAEGVRATRWGSASGLSRHKVFRSDSARTRSSWGTVLEVSGEIRG